MLIRIFEFYCVFHLSLIAVSEWIDRRAENVCVCDEWHDIVDCVCMASVFLSHISCTTTRAHTHTHTSSHTHIVHGLECCWLFIFATMKMRCYSPISGAYLLMQYINKRLNFFFEFGYRSMENSLSFSVFVLFLLVSIFVFLSCSHDLQSNHYHVELRISESIEFSLCRIDSWVVRRLIYR